MNLMDIKNYFRYYGWEILLTMVLSVTLLLTFAQGFYIPDRAADSVPLAAAVSAGVLVYCFTGNYNRRMMIGFAVLFVVAAAILAGMLRVGGTDIVDREGSGTAIYIYYIAALLIPAAVFVLSRWRIGIAVLFLAGIYMYGLMDFLHFETRPWCLVLFVTGCVVLFLLRQYRLMVMKNSTVNPAFAPFTLSTAATAAVSILLALVLFFGIIRPLDPPTMDLKLITKYLSYEILEMLGITNQYQIPNEDLMTDQQNQDQKETSEKEQTEEQDNQETDTTDGDQLQKAEKGADEDPDPATAIRYGVNWKLLVLVLIALVIASIVGAFVLRRLQRKKKIESLQQGSTRRQVVETWRFLMECFRKLGFPCPDSYTEREYAEVAGERLQVYTRNSMNLDEMTELFLKARYSPDPVSEEEAERMAQVYPAILENYEKLWGKLRFLLHYFRL